MSIISSNSASTGEKDSYGDENSSSYGSSTNATSTNSDSIKKDLAKKGSAHVFRLRVLVILILICAAAGVSVLVYSISNQAEEQDFNTQFSGAAKQLYEEFEAIGRNRISQLGSLAVASIAHGVDHSRSWPFVTLSSFQQRAYTTKVNSGLLEVSLNPLVSEEDREEWEEYVVSEDAYWIQQAVDYQASVGTDKFVVDYGPDFTNEVSYSIKKVQGNGELQDVPLGQGPYLPRWETSPLLRRDIVNRDDLKDDDGDAAIESLESGHVYLGGLLRSSPGTINDGGRTGFFAQLLSVDQEKEMEYQGDPMTAIYLPVFESFQDGRRAVAVMHAILNWASVFKNILPDNIVGVDVVLNNPCHESYTFRVNGPEVEPLGPKVCNLINQSSHCSPRL